MIISGSFWRTAIATAVVACGFVWLYEVTILDSKYAATWPKGMLERINKAGA